MILHGLVWFHVSIIQRRKHKRIKNNEIAWYDCEEKYRQSLKYQFRPSRKNSVKNSNLQYVIAIPKPTYDQCNGTAARPAVPNVLRRDPSAVFDLKPVINFGGSPWTLSMAHDFTWALTDAWRKGRWKQGPDTYTTKTSASDNSADRNCALALLNDGCHNNNTQCIQVGLWKAKPHRP